MSIANTPVEISKDNLVRFGRVLMPPDPVILSTFVSLSFSLSFDKMYIIK